VLIKNRNGLLVDPLLRHADGTAERDAALLMLHRKWQARRRRGKRGPMSVGADRGYDTRDFVNTTREMNIRPHVAQNTGRSGSSAIDARTARHAGYRIGQGKRPLIGKIFGWMKQTGGIKKPKLRGLLNVSWQFLMTAAAHNLWRLPNLSQAEV